MGLCRAEFMSQSCCSNILLRMEAIENKWKKLVMMDRFLCALNPIYMIDYFA